MFSEETNEFEGWNQVISFWLFDFIDYDQSTDENETIPNEVLFPNPELLPSWTSASTVREMRFVVVTYYNPLMWNNNLEPQSEILQNPHIW